MTIMRLGDDHNRRLRAVSRTQPRISCSQDRASDVWPDIATELGEAEIGRSAEKNRPSIVLWGAVRAIAISVGLVICLMAVLTISGVR
ncbi:MAG: hypothetical protein BGN85_00595 [Alphaproteobacteria bacterium 64-11]|mgnify:CR=1 FL=1|nr:MAG: hypothetical protein BGN85_00595 [Alphaproteobacteria bacterium 64-11]